MTAAILAAAYLRKSNDEGDKAEGLKSVNLQRDEIARFAQAHGWTLDDRYVFSDDGISGAEWGKKRPGLRALLDALDPAPFQVLIVTEVSRIGRDTIRTLSVVQEMEESGVAVWASAKGKQVEHRDIGTIVESWSGDQERSRVIERVNRARAARFEAGFVTGGKVYGYRNEPLPGTTKATRRVVNEAEAVTVRRIFEMTRDGSGLQRISKQLNAEGVPGPRAKWEPTGVREVLHRGLYCGVVVEGRVKRGVGKGGRKIRVRVPEAQWKRRADESLRIVSGVLWDQAHARIQATAAGYLRRGNQLVGKVESLRGLYLLSGLLVCGETKADGAFCRAPLLAIHRGRKNVLSYVCRAHRDQGDKVCTNSSGVPAEQMHTAVIHALKESFSPESFEAHLRRTVSDEPARESRQAERANLLDRIPVLEAEATRLADAVAVGAGTLDTLLAGIKARQAEREQAVARIAELEGIERDLRADADSVARLRETWKTWSSALTTDPATYGLARQILRKVLETPILVRPETLTRGDRTWVFAGIGRFDGILHGGVSETETVIVHRNPKDKIGALRYLLRAMGVDVSAPADAPITGGESRSGQIADTEVSHISSLEPLQAAFSGRVLA